MNRKLVTKAKLKKGVDPTIQHPVGTLDKQIESKELVKDPAKYLKTHETFFENANELKHEAGTRSTVLRTLGKKNRVIKSKANNGIVYNIIAGASKLKKQAPKAEAKSRSIEAAPKENKELQDLKAAVENQLAALTSELKSIKKENEALKAEVSKKAEAPKAEEVKAEAPKKTTRKRASKKASSEDPEK